MVVCKAKIPNTVYTKETFRTVFVKQVFGPLVRDGFKKVEILNAFGDEEYVAAIAEATQTESMVCVEKGTYYE